MSLHHRTEGGVGTETCLCEQAARGAIVVEAVNTSQPACLTRGSHSSAAVRAYSTTCVTKKPPASSKQTATTCVMHHAPQQHTMYTYARSLLIAPHQMTRAPHCLNAPCRNKTGLQLQYSCCCGCCHPATAATTAAGLLHAHVTRDAHTHTVYTRVMHIHTCTHCAHLLGASTVNHHSNH